MKLHPVAKNQTELELPYGFRFFYSYETPVAIFSPGEGAICTEEKFSVTTSRHVSAAVKRWGCGRHNVSASEFEKRLFDTWHKVHG